MIERLRGLRMDTTPLRESRDFRLLFLAGTVCYFGAMVSYVAIPYQASAYGACIALAGIEMLSYSLGPLGGQVRAGITADLWTVRGAITSGGLAGIAGVAVTAGLLRDFWSYDARTDEHAVAERAARAAVGES